MPGTLPTLSPLRAAALVAGGLLVTAAASVGGAEPRVGHAAVAEAPPPTARRPLILLVHGRGYAGEDTAALRKHWQRALNDGATTLAGRSPLRDGDVRLVWYADALAGGAGDRCTSAELSRIGIAPTPADEGVRALVGLAGGFLATLAEGAEGRDARELRNLVGDLRFIGDPARQCAAERHLGDALDRAQREGRTVVVVGHSLGAVVAWSHLSRRSGAGTVPPVQRLVTIGSPLGSTAVRGLLLGRGHAPVELPARVASWVNVVGDLDPLAVPLRAANPRVSDAVQRMPERGDPHDLATYLRSPVSASAVLGGWCAAFTSGRPRACAGVGRVPPQAVEPRAAG